MSYEKGFISCYEKFLEELNIKLRDIHIEKSNMFKSQISNIFWNKYIIDKSIKRYYKHLTFYLELKDLLFKIELP